MSLAALVLAAGSARRFGSDKLSAPFRGEPLVHHAVAAARAAPVGRVVVVAHPALEIGAWPGDPAVEVLPLASPELSASLRAGLAALEGAAGVFVFLGDMPLVPHHAAHRLAARLGDGFAAMPRHRGKPGHPVLLSARALREAAQLSGDAGFGKLLSGRADVVFEEWPDDSIHADVDRPGDLAALLSRPVGQG